MSTSGSPTGGERSRIAGEAEVDADETRAVGDVERVPDRDRLGREHPVRDRDREERPGSEDPPHRSEDLERSCQVLHRHRAERGVEGLVRPGELGVSVQVAHEGLVQARVPRQLGIAHALADDPCVRDVRREVRDPGRHEIEHARARGNDIAVRGRQRRDGRVVDVVDEARSGVEGAVLGLVGALKEARGEDVAQIPRLGTVRRVCRHPEREAHPGGESQDWTGGSRRR
jgi:hypothetical protein